MIRMKSLAMGIVFVLIIALGTLGTADGDVMLDTCLQLSSVLNEYLTPAQVEKLEMIFDYELKYENYRSLTYAYEGIDGLSFELIIDGENTYVWGDKTFVASMQAYFNAPIGMAQAEAIARKKFDDYLRENREDPAYQAYKNHFRLENITEKECFFIPSFTVAEGRDPTWNFQIFPIHASEEMKSQYDYAFPFSFLQWGLIKVNTENGEIMDFEMDGCFDQWEGKYTDEQKKTIREMLERDITDFSMFTSTDYLYWDELTILDEIKTMIHGDQPIESFCENMSHEEATFKIIARYTLLFWKMAKNRNDKFPLTELRWYPKAIEYGRTHYPEIYDNFFNDQY